MRGSPPNGARGQRLIVERAPRSAAAEAFRSLRTSLQFLPEDKTRAFVVTSPGPAEGKTTCAANLALVMASIGRHVLLIDADLRRPSLHELFGLGRVQGLTHLLVGQCGDEVIQDSGVEGLSVLASGPVPPNPAEILDRPMLDEAIRRWSDHYDHVIFDAPPALLVTDPVVLARKTRHAVLVARVGTTRDRTLQRAVKLLRDAGAEILGVVLNDLTPSQGSGYGYGYGYYYGEPYASNGHVVTSSEVPAEPPGTNRKERPPTRTPSGGRV